MRASKIGEGLQKDATLVLKGNVSEKEENFDGNPKTVDTPIQFRLFQIECISIRSSENLSRQQGKQRAD